MAIYRLNPAAATDGTGTTVNPWNTLVGKSMAADDTLLIDCNTTWRAPSGSQGFPAGITDPARITIAEFGTGERPHITGGQIITMTASGTPGVFQWSAGSNICGNLSVDGVMQTFVAWNTDLATTAAAMPVGSMSFDYTNFIMYCKPAGGSLTGKEVEASVVRNGLLFTSGQHVKTARNLRFSRMSQHGAASNTTSGITWENSRFERCGGYRNVGAAFHAGNGLEMSQNSIDCLAINCEAYDIFDSPFSSQCYGGQVGHFYIRNHEYRDCKAERFGFGAFEFSALDTFQDIRGIYVLRPYVRDGGSAASWSGDRGGKGCGIMLLSGLIGAGVLDNIHIIEPDIARCQFGLSNQWSQGTMRVDGGKILESATAWARVEQFGSPNIARTIIAVSNETQTTGVTSLGGYADALVRY